METAENAQNNEELIKSKDGLQPTRQPFRIASLFLIDGLLSVR